jgi:SAM-dependent methyltransferase
MRIARAPVSTPALADCSFYHSIDLPGLGTQTGAWDLRGRFEDYTAHEPLGDTSLLDIGAATGFLSFEAERRGAAVTSFDADDPHHLTSLPFPARRDEVRARLSDFLVRTQRGYWLCHKLLGSRAVAARGNIYDLDGCLFDVVLLGQVLVHLPDGIGALRAAASVCRDRLIVVEGVTDIEEPAARFLGRASEPEQVFAWYHYSRAWYAEVLGMLGFASVRFSTGRYLCKAENHGTEIDLTTVVARR